MAYNLSMDIEEIQDNEYHRIHTAPLLRQPSGFGQSMAITASVAVAVCGGATVLAAPNIISRRGMLAGLGCAGAAMLAPAHAKASLSQLMCPPAVGSYAGGPGMSGGDMVAASSDYSGSVPDDGEGSRRLKMHYVHTNENYDREFVSGGKYVPEALEEFTHFARDWRDSSKISFDPKCIDVIYKVWKMIDVDTPIVSLSLYRSPRSNSTVGGAKQSQHMEARAADLTHPQRSVRQIASAATALKAGGVGRYSKNNFTHVDSGRVRYWGS